MTIPDQNPFGDVPSENLPQEAPSQVDQADEVDPRPIPKLGISDLMMLTVAAALMMAPTRQALQTDDIPQNFRIITIGQHILMTLVMMTPLASLGLWLRATIRGERFPVEPGHWLLLLMGFVALVQTTFGSLWYWLGGDNISFSETLQTVMLSVYLLTMIVFAIIAFLITAVAKPKRWKIAFVVIACGYLLGALRMGTLLLTLQTAGFNTGLLWILTSVEFIANVGIVGMMVTMLVLDLRDRKHDWLHWSGIACFLASYLVMGAWQIAVAFLI